MGNRVGSDPEFKQLEFHSHTNFREHGQCEIYSLNKFPSSYVIQVITPMPDHYSHELFQQIENAQNIYLLGLYGFRNGKICHCSSSNVVSDSVVSYWEYLSYSMLDVFTLRKTCNQRFQEAQIWHIIKACVHGYETFFKLKVCFDFCLSRLLVNQEGRIRLDWMHVRPKNAHANLIAKLETGDSALGLDYFAAPEELYIVLHKQFTTKIDFEKVNIFSLGMMLLQCLTLLTPVQCFYSSDHVDYNTIESSMASCSKRYSKNLLVLVGSMLRAQPQHRPQFSTILEQYKEFLNSDFSIRTNHHEIMAIMKKQSSFK